MQNTDEKKTENQDERETIQMPKVSIGDMTQLEFLRHLKDLKSQGYLGKIDTALDERIKVMGGL